MNDAIQKFDYKRFRIDDRLQYFKPHATRVEQSFASEIAHSLCQNPKFIDSKFFYDKKGSELFEEICRLPEYYPTRTEVSILRGMSSELCAHLNGPFRLVELGSGSSTKTRLLLDAMSGVQEKTEYFPIDISEILAESSEQLLRDYKGLSITGIIDTYEGGMEFLRTYDLQRNLIVFLGSSFGNFAPPDGRRFLAGVREMMRPGDLFLIGLDMVKDAGVLEAAYNDSSGTTARFNLNILARINDELDADFDLGNFAHHAAYNRADQRIEMGLESLAGQTAVISKSGYVVRLKKGEMIRTEYSHKYGPQQIRVMLEDAGLEMRQSWCDREGYFSLTLASRA